MTDSRAPGLLTAIYDLGWYAPTFNIFEFLAGALIWERTHGFRATGLVVLKRLFADSLIFQPQAPPEYDFRIHDIVLGAAQLFPLEHVELTRDVAAVAAAARESGNGVFPPCWNPRLNRAELQQHRYYLQGFLRDHQKAGLQVPGIRVPPFAFKTIRRLIRKLPKPWISVTIRRAHHLTAKNANADVWVQVARHFERAGASVIFIPDIETVEHFSAAGPLAAMAMSNLVYRAALYDACDLNLAVLNGSIAPFWFNPSAVFAIAKVSTEGTNSSRSKWLLRFRKRSANEQRATRS